MKIIKLAILSFTVLFLLVTAMSLLIPSQIRISKAVNIRDKDRYWPRISEPKAWPQWHPLFRDRPSGRPALEINPKALSDSELLFTVAQPGRRPVANGWKLHRYEASDSMTLQWYMDFKLPWYPWEKFGSLFYENTYGAMMEQGLANLKAGE